MEHVFGDRRQRRVEAEHAAAMAHGVELEVAERDPLHLAIGRVILDPVLVAPLAIAGVEHRRVLVGDGGKLVEPPARKRAQPIKMRDEMRQRGLIKIER